MSRFIQMHCPCNWEANQGLNLLRGIICDARSWSTHFHQSLLPNLEINIMGMASELPGLREDIFSLFEATLTDFHIHTDYVLSLTRLDPLALEYTKGHQARVFGSALSIAVKMRSFYDIHRKNEVVTAFLKSLPNESEGKPLFIEATPPTQNTSLRDACNKIIHSLEVEFISGSKSGPFTLSDSKSGSSSLFDSFDSSKTQFPTHRVRLEGVYDSKTWTCTLDLVVFCSLAFALLQWAECAALT